MGLLKLLKDAFIQANQDAQKQKNKSPANNIPIADIEARIASGEEHYIIQLTGTANRDIQDNISAARVGEEVDISQDMETEKIFVDSFNSGEIGLLSKNKANLKLTQQHVQAYIYQLWENDKGKTQGSIVVFPDTDGI